METSEEPEEHNEYAPKTIKFPKFKDNHLIPLVFYKTSMETWGNKTNVLLQKQVIEGVEIPDRSPISVINAYVGNEFSHRPVIHVTGKFLTGWLRSIIIQKLKYATPQNTEKKARK